MPYYYRRRNYPWRRRRWRFRPWRPRNTFWRKRRWRRHHRVRRKRKTLPLRQWQPRNIRKCYIKGIQALFMTTSQTLTKNFRMYEHSFIPEHYPGGGGFSVTKYSLEALFEQHGLDRNWWTQTNQNLPLVRYCYCKLKFYQSRDVDYVVNYSLCEPMLATQLLYHSCQPSFMMMNKNCIFVPSKQTQKLKKPYKMLKLGPPNEILNKWYFSHDFNSQGLVMITCAAASFDNYYISPYNVSNNVSFTTLNPHFWKRHDFIQPTHEGYSPDIVGTTTKHMWTTTSHVTSDADLLKLNFSELIYLGTTKENNAGQPINDVAWDNYFTDFKKWGNPFREEYLTGSDVIIISNKNISQLKTTYGSTPRTQKLQAGDFALTTYELLITCRYSPDKDTGLGNKVYLKSVLRDTSGWEPPHKEELISEGFPLWVLFWGFLDWQRKLGEATNINRTYVLVVQSQFISPTLPYYIILDYNFIHGTSPFLNPQDHHITEEDNQNWYPSTLYQQQTIELIASTGPGTPKIPPKQSVEAKLKYSFCFKFGGCAPKMDTIKDPGKQEVYPMPSNQFNPYALQNPATRPETYLYQFDVRQDILTKAATERITRDWETKTSLFTDYNAMDPRPISAQKAQETSSDTEDSEKEEKALFQQLTLQRRKRRKLQYKLLRLMSKQ
nr:MAG: ORF1 [TTV-like mini virus]